MNSTEHTAKTPSPKTGLFATLRALLAFSGTGAPSPKRRLTSMTLAVLCAAIGALAWGAPAQAQLAHNYLFQFNEVPASSSAAFPGPVTGLESMTVDAGHLWIAEDIEGTNNFSRLDEFDAATGGVIAQPLHSESVQFLGLAVGRVSGEPEADVDVAEFNGSEASVGVYGEAGAKRATWSGAQTPAGSFGVIFGLAADSSGSLSDSAVGDVYVPVEAQRVVDVFKPEAGAAEKYVTQLTGTCATPSACTEDTFEAPREVAVDDANGDVYVTDGNVVDVFEPKVLGGYAFARQLTGTPAGAFQKVRSIAVDDATGEVYVADQILSENVPGVVDQFGPEGVYRGHLAGTPEDAFAGLRSVAVDPATHDLYVGNRNIEDFSFVDVFGPTIVLPDVTTEPASEVTQESATLNGTVNPAKAGAATCWFVYGTSTSFGLKAPCSKEVPEGESSVAVQAPVLQLLPDTTYFYRLQASNANGTNSGESAQDQEFKTLGAGIQSEFVSDAAATSARFGATIDPNGAPTTYYFQYSASDTTACGLSSCTTAPALPGVSVGSGHGDSAASQYVTDLSPGTTYHYRVVALSELTGKSVAFYGPDQTFTTQAVGGGSALLDGRSWEMVSPPNKHGALLLGIEEIGVIQAAASGGAMTYLASSPIEGEPQGYTQLTNSQTLATRTSSGWVSHDIALPNETQSGQSIGGIAEYPFFSEDLARAVVQPFGSFIPASSPQALAPVEASEQTAFLRLNYDGGDLAQPCTQSQLHSCFRPLVTSMPGVANVPPGTQFGQTSGGTCFPGAVLCGPQFVGASPDARHVVLESPHAQLTEGSNARLYEWSEGKLTPIPGIEGLGTNSTGGGGAGVRRHTISSDGSRIIGRKFEDDHLYLRDMTAKENVMLDAVQGGSGDNVASPIFQDASTDGSKIYFTDGQRLTPDSYATVGARDLYECEIAEAAGKPACELSDLTVSAGGKAGGALGVVGASEDGSWVYFVANGVLAQGATTGTCHPEMPGDTQECNLYVRHDGATQLVGILSQGDLRREFGHSTENLSMRVSPDGRWLTFMSKRELTGNDTHDAITGTPDYEVYLYHAPSEVAAEAGKLVCASCNPTGARPVGVEMGEVTLVAGKLNWTGEHVAANLPRWTGLELGYNLRQPRYLSDSGRLFFDSSDALVPQDVNGNEDVYEYEPAGYASAEGKAQCTSHSLHYSERAGGCVGLVSSGEAQGESAFLDASETGGDVFFLSAGQLSPQDYDTALDVYDAHECTSQVPCLPAPEAVSPPCDTGDSCKAAPAPQPAIYGAPASATFSGAGNVTRPPSAVIKKTVKCANGKKLSHGKCVRVKTKRKKAHKPKRSITNRRAKR